MQPSSCLALNFSSLSAAGTSQPLKLQLDRLLPAVRSVVRNAQRTARRASVYTLVRAGLLASLLGAPLAQSTQFYNKGAEPGLPFSLAVRAGDYIFISGQLGIGPAGLAKGLEAQSKQAMENIGAILKGHNLNMDDVVKCTIMLTDMSKWADFNRIYTGYFKPERLPARSAMGVSALAMGGEVEIECIAYLPRRL
ncbi:RidA family protein [Pseudoduganella danionis]|uniref:RidA family protein n=1 Tax=Pseudoduganella danionis TaxID=1890295 RepID=UPI001E4A6847|nr:RidA family protein [Pseudoduganella danionis]